MAIVDVVPGASTGSLADDVRTGLTAPAKWIPQVYQYDARGSALFEEITRQPEYYPTRTEVALLRAHGAELVALAGARELVELGAGPPLKARILLAAMPPP